MSATFVRVACPACGEVEVRGADTLLTVLNDDAGIFGFRCTVCGMWQEKQADRNTMRLIKAAGVRVVLPTPEDRPSPDAPPLTTDDLIDLMLDLERMEKEGAE